MGSKISTDLITYHYNWFRFGKSKQLRYDQIVRQKKYWDDFENGLQEIKSNTINKIDKDVILRPSREEVDPMKYASYINIEQPNAIKQHPNFIK